MTNKEKIAVRIMMFIVKMCLNYSYAEDFKQLNIQLDNLLKEEEKK